jgi:chitodextrinase
MITREQAYKLRALIEKASASLPDTDAITAPELFPKWTIKEYAVGDRVRYGDLLYKCLQNHTSQTDWTPDVAVSLWVRVDDPSIEFPEWRQPTGAQDAYMKGDKVSYEGKHYISTVDNNVWSPTTYGWSEV